MHLSKCTPALNYIHLLLAQRQSPEALWQVAAVECLALGGLDGRASSSVGLVGQWPVLLSLLAVLGEGGGELVGWCLRMRARGVVNAFYIAKVSIKFFSLLILFGSWRRETYGGWCAFRGTESWECGRRGWHGEDGLRSFLWFGGGGDE